MGELNVASVSRRLAAVRARIRDAGGDADGVRIVAVTKGFGPDAVAAAVAAGCIDIGENYAQELLAKVPALAETGATVHFLGGIQRNKIGKIVDHVDVWQSVDRLEVGEAIAQRSPGANVLVQVDLLRGALAGRGGVPLEQVAALAGRLAGLDLSVEGLMAIGPPPPADPEPAFRRAAAVAAELGLREVSMGMSGDLEAAVRAGSTMVRIGTALFGSRPERPS